MIGASGAAGHMNVERGSDFESGGLVSREKNIVFLITGIDNGGAETCLVELAVRLRSRGWSVQVISLRKPTNEGKVAALRRADIPVSSVGLERASDLIPAVVGLVRMLRYMKPFVLHTHLVHANLVGRAVRPWVKVPVLVSAARNTYEGPTWRTWAYRATDRWCDVTVQVSRSGLDRSVRTRAVPPSKIRVIPNGVDVARFTPELETARRIRAEFGVGTKFIWLAAGRLSPLKDYPNALTAFQMTRSTHPDASLWIAGDGELESELRGLAVEKGLSDHVRFLGHRTDVIDLMRAADGYLMSSAWEGMPNALLEAASMGLPIVATEVGGNSEIVVAGKTGLLVPPGNPASLAEAMKVIMNASPGERAGIANAARSHVREHYTIESMVDRWESLYQEFIERRVPA
jgi:glycosyltransferase involved in cell wall biosynthesis